MRLHLHAWCKLLLRLIRLIRLIRLLWLHRLLFPLLFSLLRPKAVAVQVPQKQGPLPQPQLRL